MDERDLCLDAAWKLQEAYDLGLLTDEEWARRVREWEVTFANVLGK